jgi:hypothetical protein
VAIPAASVATPVAKLRRRSIIPGSISKVLRWWNHLWRGIVEKTLRFGAAHQAKSTAR